MTMALKLQVANTPFSSRSAPFKDFGCVLHTTHRPVPSRVELHHRQPVYLQAKLWPDVDPARPSTAHDQERIPVCEGGHSDIHVAINALLVGAPLPKGVGLTERREAQRAVTLYRAAGGS